MSSCDLKQVTWSKSTPELCSKWRTPSFWISFNAHSSIAVAHILTKFSVETENCIPREAAIPSHLVPTKSKLAVAAIFNFTLKCNNSAISCGTLAKCECNQKEAICDRNCHRKKTRQGSPFLLRLAPITGSLLHIFWQNLTKRQKVASRRLFCPQIIVPTKSQMAAPSNSAIAWGTIAKLSTANTKNRSCDLNRHRRHARVVAAATLNFVLRPQLGGSGTLSHNFAQTLKMVIWNQSCCQILLPTKSEMAAVTILNFSTKRSNSAAGWKLKFKTNSWYVWILITTAWNNLYERKLTPKVNSKRPLATFYTRF